MVELWEIEMKLATRARYFPGHAWELYEYCMHNAKISKVFKMCAWTWIVTFVFDISDVKKLMLTTCNIGEVNAKYIDVVINRYQK